MTRASPIWKPEPIADSLKSSMTQSLMSSTNFYLVNLTISMTRWAVTARKDGDLMCPQFDSAKLFPPKDISGYKPTVGMTKEAIVTKRFVFSNSAVAALRDQYTDSTDEDSPIQPT
ncbi:hypothetical protein ACSBR1_006831 [Camellia fascicularis]